MELRGSWDRAHDMIERGRDDVDVTIDLHGEIMDAYDDVIIAEGLTDEELTSLEQWMWDEVNAGLT